VKKLLWLSAIVATMTVAGCGRAGASDTPEVNNEAPATEQQAPAAAEGEIAVASREEGSGTRSAFEELVGINEEHPLTESAIIQNGNGTVATFVEGNATAIGYVSFSTLTEKEGIHGIKVDGVEPTEANVLAGDYALSRPFVLVYDENKATEADLAFIQFLESEEGLYALQEHGAIVDMSSAKAFDMAAFDAKLTGDLKLGGSTSTESAVIAVAETFTALFPNVNYTYDSTGSGAGIKNAQDGTYSIGFSSREVDASEVSDSIKVETFCKDGIAIVVKNGNAIEDISKEQLLAIYTGEKTSWEDLK